MTRLQNIPRYGTESQTHSVWLAVMGFKDTLDFMNNPRNQKTVLNSVLKMVALDILVKLVKENNEM